MNSKRIEENVENLVEPVISDLGYDYVDCSFLQLQGRWILRIMIDAQSVITVDDCARVSRAIEDLIEVEDVISVSYSLEVSSPGLDRPLKRKRDFENFAGSEIKLKTKKPLDGRRNYRGILKGMSGEKILIYVDGSTFEVPIEMLSKAKLVPGEDLLKKRSVN